MSDTLSTAAITMSSREIAELTGKRHDNVKRTIETCAESGVLTLPQFEEVSNDGFGPKTISVYKLDKRSSLIVVAQLSPEFTARIIDRWQELETKMMQRPVQPPVAYSPTVEALCVAEVMARMLSVAESGKITMARLALECTGAKHLLPMLPVYAIDAPPSSNAGSSEATASLTDLLKEHGIKKSAASLNPVLVGAGLLSQKSRPSRKQPGTEKTFWSITPAGLEYGKNVIHPSNPRETQPHWYRSKFSDLLSLLNLK